MPTFSVKLNAMNPQTARDGSYKLDCNGNPLRSIQILQSPEQKREMLNLMKNLPRIYNDAPELFPTGKHQIGIDPVKYTVKKVCKDFTDHYNKWYTMNGNHLYESYVVRHNWMLDCLIQGLWEQGMYDEIKSVEQTYRIKLRLPRHEEITKSLQLSDVFVVFGEDDDQ